MEKIIQMYSSIPSGENEKMDISVCFSFFITVALMQQHIKKGKEEKTDETSEGFSVIKKNYQANIEMTIKWVSLNAPCDNGP